MILQNNSAPLFGVIASAVTREQLQDPWLPQVLTNWSQMGRRVTLVIPPNATPPAIKKIRIVISKQELATLNEVVDAAIKAVEGLGGYLCILEPTIVMRFAIHDVFAIAARRQLGTAWMATGFPLKLTDYDHAGPLDSAGLRWMVTSENVWGYVQRALEPDTPFIPGLWAGWVATWAGKSLHAHKYHDITDLNALGILTPMIEAPISDEHWAYWGAKATFNPPLKSFVKRPA